MTDPSPLCLFCLDELKEPETRQNPLGCGCEVQCHSSCLQGWFQQKQQLECPICHVVRVPNPVHRIEPPREYVIVRVQHEHEDQEQTNRSAQDKCIGWCCCIILFWWIGGLVLEFLM